MRLRLPAMTSLAVLSATAAAEPQTATGTLVPGREASASVQGAVSRKGAKQADDAGIESGRAMARCMTGNHAPEAEAMLATTDQTSFDAVSRRYRRSLAGCLSMAEVYVDTASIQMRVDSNTMRGLLAEARFRRAVPAGLSAVSYDPNTSGSEWVSDDAASRTTLQTADCIAARQPALAATMLSTPPGSPTEAAGVLALMPHVAGCLERNVRLTTKIVGLRLALASAMDRRMRQPVSLTGGR